MDVVETIQEFILPVSETVSKSELFVGQWDYDRGKWNV